MSTFSFPVVGKNDANGVEQPQVETNSTQRKSPRCRIRIHLVFGAIGILALLSEGLVIHTLLTTQFNDTIDKLDTDQQEILLFGAQKTLLDKVNSWLKVSETIGAKFQRRLNTDPSVVLAHIWNETFVANNSSLIDADACALVNAVQNDEVTAISIDRDGSNYKGDPSKPVDYNASDSTVFANYKFLTPCPLVMVPGEGTDVRLHRYCFNYETSKVEGFFGYVPDRYDDDGLERRFIVERDNEEIWDALIAANGKFAFSWQLLPLSPTHTVLIFVSGMIYRLDDGKNITAMIGRTAEDLAQGLESEMCSFKWEHGEFCESFLIEHTSFQILAWASNGDSGGYVRDIQSLNSTSIQTVHADLASKVHDTESFEERYIGVRTGRRWLYSAEHVLGDSETTFGDGGSLWIVLVYDRDELQEEGDEMARTAAVTLIATMVVAAFIYVVMLWYYASRISNLRRTLRIIQSAAPEESTELVDDFVDNSRIHEVYRIADEFSSVIHALTDANEEKRIVQEEQLAERTFLAYMSHHIRTPLHGVLGTCEIVLERTKEPETKEYLQAVMHCGNSLLTLLNDSIDLSRMQANKMEIEVGPVDVAKVMKVVKLTFEAQLQRGGRDLRTANPSSHDLYCIADSARLVQVTTNLVSNAIKYSKGSKQSTDDERNPVHVCSHLWDSSQAPVVTKLLADVTAFIPGAKVAFHAPDILTKQVGKPPDGSKEYVVISVTDFGRGIPENKLAKLFSPFAQMRTEDSERGAGLGLNMCFHVAILLGGFIGVISREGSGSIFYIAVPATTAPKLSRVEEKVNEDLHESDTIVVDKDNDIVLVVDDTKVNRLILARHLESLGLRSVQACDGQEAVDLVVQHRGNFRCVLTDLDMPVMDGLTAASLIKKDFPSLPIMCVSANSTPKDVELAKEAGCVGLLGKPFTKPMLKKAVAMMA